MIVPSCQAFRAFWQLEQMKPTLSRSTSDSLESGGSSRRTRSRHWLHQNQTSKRRGSSAFMGHMISGFQLGGTSEAPVLAQLPLNARSA